MSRRFEELDSLRGLAAFTVVINHHLNALPQVFDQRVYGRDEWWLAALKYSPLHAFWGGHEAALHLFFGHLPLPIIYALSLATTLLVSTLMYRLVEVPSIATGRKLASPRPPVMALRESLQPEQV